MEGQIAYRLFKNVIIKEVPKWWIITATLLWFKEMKEYYGNSVNNYDITITTVMDYFRVEYPDSVSINIQIVNFLFET